MNLIIQSCMYLLFVMGAFYFGGVSTLGTNAITTAAAVLAFGCVVAYTIKRVRSRDACEFHYGGPAGVALLIWILVLGISVYFSVYKAASFAAFAQFAGYFIIFMIILNVFDEAATMSFVRILFILGVALSLFGIAGYAMRSTVLFSFEKQVYLNRLTATFINPNHFASFLGMVLPLGLFLMLTSAQRSRTAILCGNVVMLMAFFLTFSLSGYLALMITAIVLYFLYGNFVSVPKLSNSLVLLKIVLLGVITSAIVIALCVLSPELVRAKFFSIWQREGLYRGVVAFIFSGPDALIGNIKMLLLGNGLGCFREVFHGSYGNFTVSEFYHAHNEYAEFLIESGLIAAAAFVMFVIMVLYRATTDVIKSQGDENKIFVLSCGASVLFCTIQAFFEFPFRIPFLGLTFVALAAFIMINTRRSEQACGRPLMAGAVQYAVIVLGVLACVLAVREFLVAGLMTRAEQHYEAKEFHEGDRCFQIALSIAPENARIHEHYGLALQYRAIAQPAGKREFEHASLMQYQRALGKDPYAPEYYVQVGWMLARMGEPDRATAFFDQGIALNPYFLLTYLERAHFYHYNGDIVRAAEDYNFILDEIMAIPYSQDSRVQQLVQVLHRQVLQYPLDPRLQGVYNKIAAYFDKR